jgi:glycosyltransferase involved in cell wall biosynthesis
MKASAVSLLIITEDSPESFSPAGERIKHMALAMASKRVFDKVVVLTSGAKRQSRQTARKSRVFLYAINSTMRLPFPISAYVNPMKLLMFLFQGALVSRTEKIRYIIASMPPVETGLSAWVLSKTLGVKLIVDLRDDWEASLESQVTRFIPKHLFIPLFKLAAMVYSSALCVLVITSTLENTIRKRVTQTPTILAQNGADTAVFEPQKEELRRQLKAQYDLPQDKVIMMYCGSGVNPYYRLDIILQAVKSLPESLKNKAFCVFYLYNGQSYYKRLKYQLNIPDNLVEIREPLPRSSLSRVMAAGDIGLVPFDNKKFLLYATSTKVYEYLSAGLYVVGSGPPKGELESFFARNPKLGLFASARPEDYARVLAEVLRDTSEYDDGSRNSRHQFICEFYDRQKVMLKTAERVGHYVRVS